MWAGSLLRVSSHEGRVLIRLFDPQLFTRDDGCAGHPQPARARHTGAHTNTTEETSWQTLSLSRTASSYRS